MFCNNGCILFGKSRRNIHTCAASETIYLLEKRRDHLDVTREKALQDVGKYIRAKNRPQAIFSFKRSKMLEAEIEKLNQILVLVEQQKLSIDSAKVTKDVMKNVELGAEVMERLNKSVNIEKIERLMDVVREQEGDAEDMIQAMCKPAEESFNETTLEYELDEMEAGMLASSFPDAPADALPSSGNDGSNSETPLRDDDRETLAKLEMQLAV